MQVFELIEIGIDEYHFFLDLYYIHDHDTATNKQKRKQKEKRLKDENRN